jgi:hypothetical protein
MVGEGGVRDPEAAAYTLPSGALAMAVISRLAVW